MQFNMIFSQHYITDNYAQPSPVDSMREAVFTVSPNRQYLGIACPTTPVVFSPVHVATFNYLCILNIHTCMVEVSSR